MQLSVIILNYNVRYFLETCVLSVQAAIQNIDAEIIVIDNNSSDDSCLMMKTRFPNIKLIENKQNLGFPKGNNIGVNQAKGEYICILNPDTIVAEDTFEKIFKKSIERCEMGGKCQLPTGILGCKLIDGTGNFLPESKRGVPTPLVAFTKIFGLYKISSLFGKYYAQHLTENQSGEVDILVGAFMFMKRSLYQEMGGFDENCFMYSDDIDLSYSVLKSGRINYYFADTTVIHYKGESTVRDGTYIKRFQEAMNFFYKKHFSKSYIFDTMMQFGSIIFSLFKRNQQKNNTEASGFKIDELVFFSKQNQQLNLDKKTIQYSDFEYFINNKVINYQIIFDTKSFSFKEIIAFMEANKAQNIRFRNYIPDSNFIIGSDNSNNLGEIIKIRNS